MNRHPQNPILTRHHIPNVPPLAVDVSSVFNPGTVHWNNRDWLLLRVQARSRETFLMAAESDDGLQFNVRPEIVRIEGIEKLSTKIYHIYDPRLTRIGDIIYIIFAADVDGACRLGVAQTRDMSRFELVSFDDVGDVRNGVLFPEKINGRFVRLERPNKTTLQNGVTTGSQIVLAESNDLVTWRRVAPVMQGRWHYWDELIGSGPPPVKTRQGWLHIYHGVATHFAASNIYQAGVVLLDLNDPSRVLARCRHNILEPREPWEQVGQVPNVIFPSGMIVRDVDAEGFAAPEAEVRIYYGAADTVVGLATTTIRQLLDNCHEPQLEA